MYIYIGLDSESGSDVHKRMAMLETQLQVMQDMQRTMLQYMSEVKAPPPPPLPPTPPQSVASSGGLLDQLSVLKDIMSIVQPPPAPQQQALSIQQPSHMTVNDRRALVFDLETIERLAKMFK